MSVVIQASMLCERCFPSRCSQLSKFPYPTRAPPRMGLRNDSENNNASKKKESSNNDNKKKDYSVHNGGR